MLTRLKTLGYTAHVVRDSSGYLKVRVGPYATRDAAQRAQAQLKVRLGGQPFVVEEP
jgi:cell division septation protein DedD